MARRVKTMRGATASKPSNAPKTTAKDKKAPQLKKQINKPVLGRRPLTRHSAKQGEHLFYRSLDTFSLFPQLPTEIRMQIWRELLPKPRIVSKDIHGFIRGPITLPADPGLNNDLTKHGSLRRVLRGDKKDPVSQWERNPLFIPAVAHTCQESRGLFLKHYERLSTEWDGRIGDRKGIVYMNMDQDFLDLGSHAFITLSPGDATQMKLVKNLALNIFNIITLFEVHSVINNVQQCFPAVEKIFIYLDSTQQFDPLVTREFEILLRALFADWKGPRKQKIFYESGSGYYPLTEILQNYRSAGIELDPVSDDVASIKVATMEDIRQELGMSKLPDAVYSWQHF